MSYSLRHDSASPSPVTQSLAAWGMSNVVVTHGGWNIGTLSFEIAGDFDAAAPFAYGDRITLLEGSTVRWTGRIRQMPQSVAGNTEARRYVAEDVLGDLARRTFRQTWKVNNGVALVDTALAALVLFRDDEGAAVSVGAQISAVINAAAAAGVEVQMGTATGMTANPQGIDASMRTFYETLKLCARFAPDAVPQIDHTTTPPTIHFIRRVNATERSVAVIENVDTFNATPLKDQQVSGVHITYQKQAVFLGQSYLATSVDKYPVETTGDEENALVITHQLRPQALPQSTTQSQYIETVLIEPDEFEWWERLWPELADRNEAATLTDAEIVGDPDQTRMILNGAQPAWIGSAATVTVQATFNGVIDGVAYVAKKLIAKVNASTLSTNTYSQTTEGTSAGDPGDTVPSGLAELLYGALNPLQFNGSLERARDELDWTIRPGDALNFTGTDDAQLTTARASVQSITRVLDTATETIEFGPVPMLSFADLIDLLKQQDTTQGSREFERAGGASGGAVNVDGAGMGPGASLVPTDTAEVHPFMVRHISGNNFRVEAGQIDGITIPSQTIDVGETRPVAIRIFPQYTVSVYNDEFAYAAVIKDDPDEPVLETDASLDDVTIITAAGDEGRVVIATIAALNVISQLASANITSLMQDDGSLTGQMLATWDKNG